MNTPPKNTQKIENVPAEKKIQIRIDQEVLKTVKRRLTFEEPPKSLTKFLRWISIDFFFYYGAFILNISWDLSQQNSPGLGEQCTYELWYVSTWNRPNDLSSSANSERIRNIWIVVLPSICIERTSKLINTEAQIIVRQGMMGLLTLDWIWRSRCV